MTVLLVAVAMDLALGEPPNRLHPVAWIGRVIETGRRLAPAGPPWILVVYGGLVVAMAATAAAAAAALIERLILGWPIATLLVEAWLLKCAFSLRGLWAAVARVRSALASGDLDAARAALGLHLVSRPTAALDSSHVTSGAVESLAENLTDSWIAPVAFFLVGGLPAAWAYRAVNTADAMIGYREGTLEHLGKCAARLDDALNWLPARLAALVLVTGAWLGGGSAVSAWRVMRRDAGRTASPNAGWTMAAMAGALGVTLVKPGHYRLGHGRAPDLTALDRSRRVAGWASVVWLVVALLGLWGLSR